MYCTRCKKHVDQLTPFDIKEVYSLATIGDNKLVKNFRVVDFIEYNQECEEILKSLESGLSINSLNSLYGSDKVKFALMYESMRGNFEKSWECKDCIAEEGDWCP